MLKRQKPTVIYYDFTDFMDSSANASAGGEIKEVNATPDTAPNKLSCFRRTNNKRSSKSLSSGDDTTSHMDETSFSHSADFKATEARTNSSEMDGKRPNDDSQRDEDQDGIAPAASNPLACLIQASPLRFSGKFGFKDEQGSREVNKAVEHYQDTNTRLEI